MVFDPTRVALCVGNGSARVATWLLHMALPVLALWLLLVRPQLDLAWDNRMAHFVLAPLSPNAIGSRDAAYAYFVLYRRQSKRGVLGHSGLSARHAGTWLRADHLDLEHGGPNGIGGQGRLCGVESRLARHDADHCDRELFVRNHREQHSARHDRHPAGAGIANGRSG